MGEKKASILPKMLLLLWTVASLGWAVWAWGFTEADRAFDNYRVVWRYENNIQRGAHNPIMRTSYLNAAKRANDSSPKLGKFVLLGLGIPLLALGIGCKLSQRKK